MKDWPQGEITFEIFERLLDLGEQDIELPKLSGIFAAQVGAKQIADFGGADQIMNRWIAGTHSATRASVLLHAVIPIMKWRNDIHSLVDIIYVHPSLAVQAFSYLTRRPIRGAGATTKREVFDRGLPACRLRVQFHQMEHAFRHFIVHAQS